MKNKADFAILVDSCCDVPVEYQKEYPIYMVPLNINYKNATYRDRIDITPEEIYDNLDVEVPKTSLPSYEEAVKVFEKIASDGYTNVIAIHISSNLSGTLNQIRLVSEEYKNRGIKTYVYDTKNIAIGSGMYALFALRQLKAGRSYEETIKMLDSVFGDSKLYFCVETLEYLYKGGRIGRVASLLGAALGVRPVITCDEAGTYTIAGKERGSKRCIEKAVNLVAEFASKGKKAEIIIMCSGKVSGLEKIKERLEHLIPHSSVKIEGQISPVLGVHVGPGLIGIAVFLTD